MNKVLELLKRAQSGKAAQDGKKKKMIDGLNGALSDEFAAVQLYTVASTLVTGPMQPGLAEYLAEEGPEELQHAKFLSEKIVAMGGQPEVVDRDVAISPVTNRHIFEVVREKEAEAVATYTRLAQLAEDMGDRALQIQLEDILSDEQKHLEGTERILAGWKG